MKSGEGEAQRVAEPKELLLVEEIAGAVGGLQRHFGTRSSRTSPRTLSRYNTTIRIRTRTPLDPPSREALLALTQVNAKKALFVCLRIFPLRDSQGLKLATPTL